eukprot:UN10096
MKSDYLNKINKQRSNIKFSQLKTKDEIQKILSGMKENSKDYLILIGHLYFQTGIIHDTLRKSKDNSVLLTHKSFNDKISEQKL